MGPFAAPIWTPRNCPRCDLNLEDRTFWNGDHEELRASWVAGAGKAS
jgi:hypothetical protein